MATQLLPRASATPSPATILLTAPTMGCVTLPLQLASAELASRVPTVASSRAYVTAHQLSPTAALLLATPQRSAAALALLTVLVDAVTRVRPTGCTLKAVCMVA